MRKRDWPFMVQQLDDNMSQLAAGATHWHHSTHVGTPAKGSADPGVDARRSATPFGEPFEPTDSPRYAPPYAHPFLSKPSARADMSPAH